MESLTKCDFFGNAFCKNVHRLRANRKHRDPSNTNNKFNVYP